MGTIENTVILVLLCLGVVILLALYRNSKEENYSLKRKNRILYSEKIEAKTKLWMEITSNYNKIAPLHKKIKSLQNRLMTKSEEIERLKSELDRMILKWSYVMEERLALLKELSSAKERIAQLERITETHITAGSSATFPDFPVK